MADAIVFDPADVEVEDVKKEAAQEAPAESSPDESKEKVADTQETEEPADKETDSTEPEQEEVAEDTTVEQPTKADDRKQQLNTEIRDLVSRRNALKQEVERSNAEVYQPATENELVDTGMTELEAKVEAMRQTQEMDKFNSQVADAQLTIESEAQRVLQDFPIFDSTSPDYKESIAIQTARLLEKNLIYDQNTGQVIGSHSSPYELYKTIADAHNSSAEENQIKGQKATEKMLASVDSLPSGTVKEAPEDLFLKGLMSKS